MDHSNAISNSTHDDPAPYKPNAHNRRRTLILCSLLIALALGLSLPTLGNWARLAPDSIAYLTAARSLIEDGGFPPHQLMRPPGFPTLISPLLLLDDTPLLAVRILLIACWAVSGVLTFFLFRRELGTLAATITGILVVLNTVLFMQTTVLLTEPVFLALMLGALTLTMRWRHVEKLEWVEVVLAGWLIALTILVRSMGAVLIPAAALALLCRKPDPLRRRILHVAILSACSLAPWAGWQFRQYTYPESYTYGNVWATARSAEKTRSVGVDLQFERLWKFGPMRLDSIKEAVVPQRIGGWRLAWPPYNILTTYLISGLLVAIALLRLALYRSPIDAFVLLVLFMLALWPWDEGVRLVSPLIPLFYGYILWLGLRFWRKSVRLWQKAPITLCLAVLLGLHVWEMGILQARLPKEREKAEYRFQVMHTLADWQTENIPKRKKITAVLSDLNDTKPMLAGSAYLSRRPIEYLELNAEEAEGVSLKWRASYYVFVDELLMDTIPRQNTHAEIAAVEGFVILAPVYD